jgi:hypothetical protein
MEQKTLDLFLENYQNKGICSTLPKFTKVIKKEFKKSNITKEIKYYPWAVVERLFRMQGGSIEVVDWAKKVEFEYSDYAPNENGELVMTEQKQHALFVQLKATWHELTEEEFYPIFDNQSAKIIKTPNALDLNTARQRGMVRLIARISGIGLDIFEQQDGDLDADPIESVGETTAIKVEKKTIPTPKPKTMMSEPNVILVPLATPTQTPQEPQQDFLQSFLNGGEVEPSSVIKEKPKQAPQDDSEFGNDTQEYADLLLEVRKTIRDNGAQTQAKEYVQSLDKELLSELTYGELSQLKTSI